MDKVGKSKRPYDTIKSSQKKIIISSDCPTGPSEILLNGKCGFLYKTGDYVNLSKYIEYVSKNFKTAKKMAMLGFQNFKKDLILK